MTSRHAATGFAILLIASFATAPAPASAEDVDAAPAARLVVLSDAQLDDARGGFDWGGMSVVFGADMSTFLNGELALHTVVQWSASGASTQTTIGAGVTQATLAQMQSQVPGSINVPAMLAGSSVYFANGGQTALVQGASGGLQNVLLNSATGLTALQQTNATISLGNYAAFAAGLHNQALGASLGAEIAGLGR